MKKILYSLLKKSSAFVFNILYKIETEGLENIPRDGKAILAANHASFLDSMIMFPTIPRKFHAVTGKWLFKIWWLGWLFKVIDCIPTNGSSVGAIRVLEKEEMILIYPEGRCKITKEEAVGPAHKGVAIFALKTGAPVIPIAIKGTYEAWPQTRPLPHFFKNLKVCAGRPLVFDKCSQKTIPEDLLESTLSKIMAAIHELLK